MESLKPSSVCSQPEETKVAGRRSCYFRTRQERATSCSFGAYCKLTPEREKLISQPVPKQVQLPGRDAGSQHSRLPVWRRAATRPSSAFGKTRSFLIDLFALLENQAVTSMSTAVNVGSQVVRTPAFGFRPFSCQRYTQWND